MCGGRYNGRLRRFRNVSRLSDPGLEPDGTLTLLFHTQGKDSGKGNDHRARVFI